MNRDPEQLRRELADLVNDQADTAELRTLTDAERRGFEERQERINELCDELHRFASRTHSDAEARNALISCDGELQRLKSAT
jgi:hypothetical protein